MRDPTTRAQLSGHRFLLRRLALAVMRGDARMLHDPLRSQRRAGAVGAAVAVLALVAAGVLALLRPLGEVADAPIVVAEGSGALFVVIDGRLHPTPNLASARLVAGRAADPRMVAESRLREWPRGPLVGIHGAPDQLLPAPAGPPVRWALCESATDRWRRDGRTGVYVVPADVAVPAGADVGGSGSGEDGGDAVLVGHGERRWLLRGGRRSEVPADPAVDQALGLAGASVRPVSEHLLRAVPEAPAITVPRGAGAGDERGAGEQHADAAPGSPGVPSGARTGDLLRVPGDDTGRRWWVRAGGVAPVGEVAAHLLLAAGSREVEVTRGRLGGIPVVAAADVAHLPERSPRLRDATVLCAWWTETPAGPRVSVTVGETRPLPANAAPVLLATADRHGPALDEFWSPPGFVRLVAGGVPGRDGAGAAGAPGTAWLITDTGVRHGVPDAEVARMLGVGEAPTVAPWSLVAGLHRGPELRREDALRGHDAGGEG